MYVCVCEDSLPCHLHTLINGYIKAANVRGHFRLAADEFWLWLLILQPHMWMCMYAYMYVEKRSCACVGAIVVHDI